MVARNVVDSQRRSDPGSIPGGATQCVNEIFLLLFQGNNADEKLF